MNARLDIRDSKDSKVKNPDAITFILIATGEINRQCKEEESDTNELKKAFHRLSNDLELAIIEKFPELKDNFPSELAMGVNAIFNEHTHGIKFILDELLKNAMDASVMASDKKEESNKFDINIKIKINKKITDKGNEYSVKISDNGAGFKNLKQSQKKEYSALFPEKNIIHYLLSFLFYMFCCCFCLRDPLINSTKKEKYLLGNEGVGLKYANNHIKNFGGDLFFKNRKTAGAKVEVNFLKERLPHYTRR